MAQSWDSFFVAQVGGTAALTGLVFVALSINLGRILESSQLVERAAEAVILLVQPVIVGLGALVPDVDIVTTGILCGASAFGGFVLLNRLIIKGRVSSRGRPAYEFRSRVALAELGMLPSLVGAIVMLSGSSSGFYWIAIGAAAALVVGIFDAWILLVEILR